MPLETQDNKHWSIPSLRWQGRTRCYFHSPPRAKTSRWAPGATLGGTLWKVMRQFKHIYVLQHDAANGMNNCRNHFNRAKNARNWNWTHYVIEAIEDWGNAPGKKATHNTAVTTEPGKICQGSVLTSKQANASSIAGLPRIQNFGSPGHPQGACFVLLIFCDIRIFLEGFIVVNYYFINWARKGPRLKKTKRLRSLP